ncbi:MAG: S8 family serine peptidase [Peptococcaceae bacterium]|nr:S8 family serine peptidase [Peptococcaceae bacterium]
MTLRVRKKAVFSPVRTGLTPFEIRRAYNIPRHLNGSGQTIALLEFGSGCSRSDIDTFVRSFQGIFDYDLHFVSLDGADNNGDASPDDMEATLDIEWVLAMAPSVRIVVYEAPGVRTYGEFGRNLLAVLRYVVNDRVHKPSVISISYGDAEENFIDAGYAEVENVLTQAAAKGISVFISSGDQGAYGSHRLDGEKVPRVDFPASCPHAMAVGGTSLAVNPYAETAWTYWGPRNGGATGGGFSRLFPAPYYQLSHLVRYKETGRGVPDVAAVADPANGCQVVFEGRPQVVGGTSLSAPIWAGITALVNQATGKRAGLFTPALYQNASPMRDITQGNNNFNSVLGYQAGPGWDPCTGLGSPDVGKLIDLLAGKPVESGYVTTIRLTAGQRQYTVNRRSKWMEAAPILVSPGQLYVSVRVLADILGARRIEWEDATKTAVIRK